MIRIFIFCTIVLLASGKSYGQNSTFLKGVLKDSSRVISIEQELNYHNSSSDTLQEIYFNDWINAFRDKSTPLAVRFSEDYIRRFHFAAEEQRGSTTVHAVQNSEGEGLTWSRPPGAPDLLKVDLEKPLAPGESVTINFSYQLKIPSAEFTRYGYYDDGTYKLRYWFLTPGVYNKGWEIYSHKNLNDQYNHPLDIEIEFQIPHYFSVISALKAESLDFSDNHKTFRLTGEEWLDFKLYLTRAYMFEDIETENFHVLTNIEEQSLSPVLKTMLVRRITEFLESRLGPYPHDLMLATREDYATNPFYGLNQLPHFIRPFPEGFNYDLQQLKTITGNFLDNTLLLNPREDRWVHDAIQTYLLMDYMDEYYPNMKILGSLSDVIGIRWFHAADLEFNDQYPLLYLHMARTRLDQPLTTPQDSLLKFNKNLGNPYKAGAGLKYVENFLQDETVPHSIKEFYSRYRLEKADSEDFEMILKKNAHKDIDWFFDDYVGSDVKIDFTIQDVQKTGDSLEVTVRNKTGNGMPVSLYGLNDQEVVYKTWIEDVGRSRSITIPSKDIKRLALNYEGEIPELNQRDNYKGVTTFLDKPFQVRLLKDVEDPRYRQVFFIPEFRYNLYDGITVGPKLYNTTLLERNFEFDVTPMYGFNSQTIVGGAGFAHRIYFDDEDLFYIRYGASGSRYSYGYDLFYQKLTPFLTMAFRGEDLRDNKKQFLSIRNVNVFRDQNLADPLDVTDYSVFNVKYTYSDKGMIDYLAGGLDFQLAGKFSKASVTVDYRKLFKNNRQIDLRFFGGAFLYNDFTHSNYFSFALDRPTDYLFDYNYYGRSETSGLFSQQIIMAEGGFKSQLQPEFANQWLTTVNASTNLWKWIFVYGDAGLVKNKHEQAQMVYDSGIRLNLIADYFEVFFPVYSNLGWEVAQDNYDQRIRFIATLDLKTLTGLFSREWY